MAHSLFFVLILFSISISFAKDDKKEVDCIHCNSHKNFEKNGNNLEELIKLKTKNQAEEKCSVEFKKDLAFLLSTDIRKKAEGLKDDISFIPVTAPESAAKKNEKSFCYYVKGAATKYESVAKEVIPKINKATEDKLAIHQAYMNSALQLVQLSVQYCDDPKCDGGIILGMGQPANCASKVIQERLNNLRNDIPRITELYQRIDAAAKNCGL